MSYTDIHKKYIPNIPKELLICFFLVLATIAVYWQVREYDFINYDDPLYVTGRPNVQSGLHLTNVYWSLTAFDASNWHPLTWLSHMLDCELYGMDAGKHHLTNVLFHIANSILLFLVLNKMTGAIWRSGFVSALFALHPLHVESVAWISERKDVLSTFFWMLVLWSYARYSENPSWNRYLTVFLFFILGLMSKPMVVTLPFVMLLLDYWPLNRFKYVRLTKLIYEKIPFVGLSALLSIVTLIIQKKGGSVGSLEVFTVDDRISNALVSYVSYIGKMIWPAELSIFYPHPDFLPAWKVLSACVVLGLISSFVLYFFRRYPYLATGWLWFIGTLVPVIGLVQVGLQGMADRYTYIPLIGLFIMIAWSTPEIFEKVRYGKESLVLIAAAIIMILMVISWFQVGYWKNSRTLFEHAIKVTVNNHVAQNNLGLALSENGKNDEAISHYSEALRIEPGFDLAHNNLGAALYRKGEFKKAILHYSKALKLNPDYANAHYNLGNALMDHKKIDDAIYHFSEALRINPDDVFSHNNLGVALVRTGRVKEAIKHYIEALIIDSNFDEARANLRYALAAQGKNIDVVEKILKSLK